MFFRAVPVIRPGSTTEVMKVLKPVLVTRGTTCLGTFFLQSSLKLFSAMTGDVHVCETLTSKIGGIRIIKSA